MKGEQKKKTKKKKKKKNKKRKKHKKTKKEKKQKKQKKDKDVFVFTKHNLHCDINKRDFYSNLASIH